MFHTCAFCKEEFFVKVNDYVPTVIRNGEALNHCGLCETHYVIPETWKDIAAATLQPAFVDMDDFYGYRR